MKTITREDFIGFPKEVTDLPIYDGEDGEIFGWGHLDKKEVLESLKSIAAYCEFTDGELDGMRESDISHSYAKQVVWPDHEMTEDDWAFQLCSSEDEGSFPVTYVYV